MEDIQPVMKRTIISLYQAQSDLFVTYLNKVKANYSMEDIHQLRVCIKNLRVLLSIAEISGKGHFYKKCHFRLFAGLFKSAGKVRGVQINIQLSKRRDKIFKQQYHKYLLKCQKKNLTKLKKEVTRFQLRKLKKLNRRFLFKTGKISDSRFTKTVIHYIKLTQERIHKIKYNLDEHRGLHQIRIELKRLEEILKVLRKSDKSCVTKFCLKSIRDLRNVIGEWHDLVEFIDSVEVFSEHKKYRRSRGESRKLIKTLKKKKKHLRTKIIKELKTSRYDGIISKGSGS